MEWTKGNILWGRKGSDAIHPIIFLSDYNTDCFIGAMITHGEEKEYKDNVLMSEDHFEKLDLNQKKYGIYFDDTYLVKTKLLKKLEWEPFKKDGQLTAEGIKFVEKNLKNEDPVLWENYLSH